MIILTKGPLFDNSFIILFQNDHLSNINFKRFLRKGNSKQILSSQYGPTYSAWHTDIHFCITSLYVPKISEAQYAKL